MTHSEQLGSKLISMLLVFAMILALLPAVSFTASAEETERIGFYCEGSYDISKPCYISSATYNGKPLELQGTFPDEYYLAPVGAEIEVTLVPDNGYRIEKVSLMEWKSDVNLLKNYGLSPGGTYTVTTDGRDKLLVMAIYSWTGQQYYNVDIADSLKQDISDGKINSVMLTYHDGTATNDFPAYALNDKPVAVSIDVPTDSNGEPLTVIESINGAEVSYNSDEHRYTSEYFSISQDTAITVQYGDNAELCTVSVLAVNLPNTENKVAVVTAPYNSRGQYKVGTECEIFANVTEDKFIGDADFNGIAIEPYKEDSDGCYYKVTTAAGENKFVISYADLSTLTIPKPANGSVNFSGRLDGGRSSETLSDGTQVYSIGTGDMVTLTITPDEGYRIKSVKLDGNKAPEVTVKNGVCTFMMDQLVSWTFTAEFEKISADYATVTVKCGENGTVTPSTSDYPIGTEVTLTVTPDKGYQVKSATLDGKTVRLTNGKFTFTLTADCVFSVEFRKKSTGGSSSVHYPSGSGSTAAKDYDPVLNGNSMSWSEIAAALSKMDENSKVNIDLNGSTVVSAEILKAIKDNKISANLKFDSSKSWTIDGSRITSESAYADLSLLPGTSSAKGARGIAGYRFTTGGNNVGAELNIKFRDEYVGKIANLYFIKDGSAEFVSAYKIAGDGYAVLPGAAAKGEYVIMLGDYSDLNGDVNNDGTLNALDANAVLRDITGLEAGANPLMADFNGDGEVNALDASDVLKKIAGLI